jgi:alpha-amylase
MTSVVLYFQVHQPFRLRRFRFFDIGHGRDYFDDAANERIARRIAQRCYLPMNALLLRLIERTDGRFRCAFSVTGTALDQMERWAPDALDGFVALARTGAVELLCETSHHSLASFANAAEFRAQIRAHRLRIERVFGVRPRTFRNTELACDDEVARIVERMGFTAILAEGAERVLEGRTPHSVYRPRSCSRIKVLLRDYGLSDDIAFRFSERRWSAWPLTAEKFAAWIGALPEDHRCVGLFMDYETFGEHQAAGVGIFEFVERLPMAVLANARLVFETPAEVAAKTAPAGEIAFPRPFSWADVERDLTAWLGNPMQRAAHRAIYSLRAAARRAAARGDDDAVEIWRRLTTSDHFYYMCTKWFADGDVHKYFNHFESPHEAFIAYMNVVDAFARRVRGRRVPVHA